MTASASRSRVSVFRRGRLAALVAVATLAAGTVALLLPPAAAPTEAPTWEAASPTARGVYHVHSDRSDGTGTLDEIGEAAAAAGLDFVIVTDHGDGMRAAEPPRYRSGVLMVDAVEISTSGGHVVALDLPTSPYALAGSPAAVVEDVRRMGGMAIAAHPDSVKAELRWTDWEADMDGLEWLNADSEWRDELWSALGRGLLTYAFRPAETLAVILDRPQQTLDRWDHLARTRPLVGLAGTDAHARLGYRQSVDPYHDRVLARLPRYTSSFKAFQNHLVLDRPLSGDAAADAGTLMRAIRAGRVYTTIDGLARAGAFEMAASSGGRQAGLGAHLDIAGPVLVESRVAAPPGTALVLLRDGSPVHETTEGAIAFEAGTAPGVYRIEARLVAASGRVRVPWLVSNPIYVGLRDAHHAAREARWPVHSAPTLRRELDPARWRPETSPGSESALHVAGNVPGMTWRFSLADKGQPSAYAAAQFPVDGGAAGFDRVLLSVRAGRPMRIWAQLRSPATGERWGTTFFADGASRDLVLPFDTFEPIGVTSSPSPPLAAVDSLLLVADTLNHRPGDGGELQIGEFALAR